MSEIKTPTLVDAQYMQQQHPETFEAPSIEELKELKVGDYVKICAERERFWVIINQIYENGKIKALINNDLLFSEDHNLFINDEIIFTPRNIYSILKSQ